MPIIFLLIAMMHHMKLNPDAWSTPDWTEMLLWKWMMLWSLPISRNPYCLGSGSCSMSIVQSTAKYWSRNFLYCIVPCSTTLYDNVLRQNSSLLQRSAPILPVQYHSLDKENKVQLQYYEGLLQPCCFLQHYSVPQNTTPRLQRASPELPRQYFSPTPVLLQYYSNTTPTLLQYYSSTTSFYKELLQYYPTLQSSSSVPLHTTNYWSSTTNSRSSPYYKVPLQFYFVLQKTSPVLRRTLNYYCATKYNSSTSPYYRVVLKYYKVLLQ